MTVFLRLLAETDKAAALQTACSKLRSGVADTRCFEVAPSAFDAVPGKPFAYWVSDAVRETFRRLPAFEGDGRTVKQGLATADDFRFVRAWWEIGRAGTPKWFGFAKGGAYSPFYADVYLVVNWVQGGAGIKNNLNEKGSVRSNVWMLKDTAPNFFFRPGITWPRRTNGLSFRVMPAGCVFADKGPAVFVAQDNQAELLALSCLLNSRAFGLLVAVQLARVELAQSFEVGLIQQTPIPPLTTNHWSLATLARRAWSLKRTLDTINETSHAFVLPFALQQACGYFNPTGIHAELADIQAKIDAMAFDLYGFSEADRQLISRGALPMAGETAKDSPDDDDADPDELSSTLDSASLHLGYERAPLPTDLLSWAVGVAFGRFDWRLATGERQSPPEPEPFDALPAKSPGMLPDGAEPFHVHAGILVDDKGHPHDLAHLMEEVLHRVDQPVPDDVRRWLQRDFFAHHLQRYSKSRRKAPIYWPLTTTSGGYTLWLYYPSLTSQTIYTAINDFVEPMLRQVGADVTALRNQGTARTRDDEKRLEELQNQELELLDLQGLLLKIAPNFQPHHDDGIQISAAPLWPLFRHKPWQKVLKDTWIKLEKGDYDWAHLAMNYWPDRVREKCQTDKSLAIAHGLESLYVEPEAKPKKTRSKAGTMS